MTNDQIAEIRDAIAKECPKWLIGVNFISNGTYKRFGFSHPTLVVDMTRFKPSGICWSFQECFSEHTATDPMFDIGRTVRNRIISNLKHLRRKRAQSK